MKRLWAFGTFLLLMPSPVLANGAYTHVHMSQIAADSLGPGALSTLLSVPENRAALEAGSMFPDSGYAVEDAYGELAHWEPFLSALIEQLRSTNGSDFSSPEAQRHAAFMLGVASHGMADQSYDTTLLNRAFEVDGPEHPDASVDQYADYFIVIDEGVVFSVEPWAPYTEIAPAVGAVGHTVTEATLLNGVTRMSTVLDVQARVARNLYWDAWTSYPFLGTHIYNPEAVGSAPWVAALVQQYWQVLWDRLHMTDDPDTQLIIRTVPEDGGVNWPVDLEVSEAWGRPAVWFGYGIDRDQVAGLITLRDEESGLVVPVTLETPYGGRERNLIFLRPDTTLAYDTAHTVEVEAGVTTIDGRVSTVPQSFSFRTQCAPERLADCPAVPDPLVAGPIPTRPDAGRRVDAGVSSRDAGPAAEGDGGCSTTGAVSSTLRPGWLGLLLGLALFGRRRRR